MDMHTIMACFPTTPHDVHLQTNAHVCYSLFTVDGLARLWTQGMPRKTVQPRMFTLPNDHTQLKSFIDKYDQNQQQLQTLAAVDDLLSGKLLSNYTT